MYKYRRGKPITRASQRNKRRSRKLRERQEIHVNHAGRQYREYARQCRKRAAEGNGEISFSGEKPPLSLIPRTNRKVDH